MTVKELREKLNEFSDDTEVRIGVNDIPCSDGFIYGYSKIDDIYYDGFYDRVFIEGTDM